MKALLPNSATPSKALQFTHEKSQGPEFSVIEIEQTPNIQTSIDVSWLQEHLTAALQIVHETIGRRAGSIDILIANDVHMVELNRKHHGRNAITDVLSFDLCEKGSSTGAPGALSASIAINADEASRRAAEFGHSIERELLLYAIHGVLHCAGLDDHDEAGFNVMHAMEDQILERIGVGATFRSAARDDAGGAPS